MTNWKVTEPQFKEAIAKYDGTLASLYEVKKSLAGILRTEDCYKNFPPNLIKILEEAETESQVNEVIEAVHDYADYNKIWLGL